jgi:meso-butanediol dehydrogenase / (S,S)-butanediol dehydrogenase / diacetyl reductase
MRFEGKRAIVTGAASGIGLAVAKLLASEGATVVIGDRNEEGLNAAAAEIGSAAHAVAIDVSDPAACARIVETTVRDHGGLEILCNIAGVLDMAPLAQFTAERWARMIGVNLSGVFFLSQAAMPHLIETRGTVVNMASAAGLVGVPYNSPYSASKHGVVGLTKAMALEFANQGVRINAICPGGVKTPMLGAPPPEGVDWEAVMRSASWLDHGEMCDPEDIANAVAFLASNDARMITGVAFPVDGGQTAG